MNDFKTDPTSIVEQMFKNAPPAITRAEVARRSGGYISQKRLANLDCQGDGIPGKFRLGLKIMYPTANVVEFFKSNIELEGGA